MFLCEICEEGQTEMCEYFKEHYLESGKAVRSCPKFSPQEDVDVEVIENRSAAKVVILSARTVRMAMDGKQVLILTKYKGAQSERVLNELKERGMQEEITDVTIRLKSGGEIVIRGTGYDSE